jgi:hypothetical protein
MKTESPPAKDPKAQAHHIQRMLTQVIEQLRHDAEKPCEPKAQVLFETTAEILIALRTAYEHYESDVGKSA